jgi:lipopolysaccharide export system protein LptA
MIIIASLISLYQLQAEKTTYNGRDLILTQAVEMTHPAGRLSANRAVVQNFKMDQRTPFQKISLDGQVCVHAVTANREINLFADRASGEIDVGALFGFQSLRCQGAVEITTNDGFTAKGGEARFSALANRGGSIELIPSPLSQYCFLTHECDHLEARKMRLDLETKQIICEEIRGEIEAGWNRGSSISFHAERLIWDQDLLLEGNVSFEDEQTHLEADQGRLIYQERTGRSRPEALHCEGSVRMISSIIQDQESFALADRLIYIPETRTMILSCIAPNRVLFWQSSGDISLSAPEVRVQMDPMTQRESVQGIGDVHFHFTLQEENIIETLFSKYL